MRTDRRAAFLAGEGTLTAREVREWATEMSPTRAMPILPSGMSDDEPLMVSVVPGPPDYHGLSGVTVLAGRSTHRTEEDRMSEVGQCSHQTIAEWTALYAERDRLERLWKSAEVQCEKSDAAYVAATEQLREALDALREARAFLDTRHGSDGKMASGCPPAS